MWLRLYKLEVLRTNMDKVARFDSPILINECLIKKKVKDEGKIAKINKRPN